VGRKGIGIKKRNVIGRIYFVTIITNYALRTIISFLGGIIDNTAQYCIVLGWDYPYSPIEMLALLIDVPRARMQLLHCTLTS
jgi:hypothetical protein